MQKPSRKNAHQEIEKPSLLTANKAREFLKNLNGWQLTDDHKMIYREFILQDFRAAIDLIDRIAIIAEDEKHHPDIHLTQYRNLRVGLTSHDVGGLSEKDLIAAKKINELSLFNKTASLKQQLQTKEHVQATPRQRISLTPKNNDKTKGIQTKKRLNRVHPAIKKT